MNDSPYFFTWTSQDSALKIPLESTTNFEMISSGQKLIDMSSLSYQASFGLKNKTITDSISQQMQSFSLASPKNTFTLKKKVSELLDNLAAKNLNDQGFKCFFTQSGSESIENALKMARQISKKKYILAQQNSYHGSSLGALSVTGDWRNKTHLSLSKYTIRIPGPTEDPKAIEFQRIVKENLSKGIAAICLETITGGNGVIIPSKGWYKKVQQVCRENRIFIILDEVVCAGHRTGPFFGFQNYPGLVPDFICLAKALTGGFFPLGAVLVNKSFAHYYDENTLSCGLTNYGHPLGLAAALAVIKISQKKSFQNRLACNQQTLSEFALSMRRERNISSVRLIGMLMAIELRKPVEQRQFIKNGIYLAVQKQRPIIAPPLNMPPILLKKGLSIISKVISEQE